MLRHPVQITSLEEDFKRLGLLNEQEEVMTQTGNGAPAPGLSRGPAGKPAPNKNGSRNVGAQTDGDEDEGKDGTVTVPGHQGEPGGVGPKKPALPVTAGAQHEATRGADPRRVLGASKDAEEDDDEDEDEDEDDDKEESIELEGSNKVTEALARIRGAKVQAEETQVSTQLDKVAALIADVNSIMESVDVARRGDATRAFANSAAISEMLAKGFAHFADLYEDEEFASAAEAFAAMSQDAAQVANALEEGEEIEVESLQSEFKAQMDALMEGLDLYSDVVESDAELDEEDEDLEEDEEEDEVEEDTEEEAAPASEEIHHRPTGGIVSQRVESYFRQGQMGPSGKKTAGMKK